MKASCTRAEETAFHTCSFHCARRLFHKLVTNSRILSG
jgi:hypothetical protein